MNNLGNVVDLIPGDDETDAAILERHDRQSQAIAEAVFGLVERFAAQGLAPVSVFEGAIKGAVMAMAHANGYSPREIADLLDDVAEALRAMTNDAFKPVAQ